MTAGFGPDLTTITPRRGITMIALVFSLDDDSTNCRRTSSILKREVHAGVVRIVKHRKMDVVLEGDALRTHRCTTAM